MGAGEAFPWLLAGVRLAGALVDWLVTYAIHSTILIGGVWAVSLTRAGRRLSSAATARLWRFALVGGIASAALQSLDGRDPLSGTLRLGAAPGTRALERIAGERRDALPVLAAVHRFPPGAGVLQWRGVAPATNSPVRTVIAVSPSWMPAALAAWLAGAGLCAVLYARARRRFLRLLASRRNGAWTLAGGALRAVVDRAGVRRPVALTVADCLTSPVALGGREICIPARVLAELDPIRMESILAHELAHLERRDPAWLALARAVEAVLFFQPLNRLARARMQEAAEFASDAWAAGVVSRPLDLAHCLARVAEWTVGSTRVLAPAMAERPGGVLLRRVRRLTTVTPPAGGTGNGGVFRVACVATVAALVLMAPRAAIGVEGGPATPRGALFMIRVDDATGGQPGGVVVRDLRVVRFAARR